MKKVIRIGSKRKSKSIMQQKGFTGSINTSVRHRYSWNKFREKLGNTFPALWILINPFFINHCLAATRHAKGEITFFPARMDISAARSRIQLYIDFLCPLV